MDTLEHPTDLEIFVITNGRSTFEYVMKSLEAQSVKRKVTVIRNMKWVDALNLCAESCTSDFFLRVDDDMFLHPMAVEYYISKIPKAKRKRWGVYVCRLWEDWSNKPVNGLRMYSRRAAKKIKFTASALGKVDKLFKLALERKGSKQVKDGSVVGIHSLAPVEDQMKYRSLWRDKNATISKEKFARTFDNKIHKTNKSLSEQYLILNDIPKINSNLKTNFRHFLSKRK